LPLLLRHLIRSGRAGARFGFRSGQPHQSRLQRAQQLFAILRRGIEDSGRNVNVLAFRGRRMRIRARGGYHGVFRSLLAGESAWLTYATVGVAEQSVEVNDLRS